MSAAGEEKETASVPADGHPDQSGGKGLLPRRGFRGGCTRPRDFHVEGLQPPDRGQ